MGYTEGVGSFLLTWSARRWTAGLAAGAVTFLVLGWVSAVLPNPVIGRSVPATEWAMAALLITSVLSGMLAATYVRSRQVPDEGTARRGALGAALAYVAIGCPVCNKLVLLAVGSTGAVQYVAPVQPYVAIVGIALLAWALVVRLRAEAACSLPLTQETESHA